MSLLGSFKIYFRFHLGGFVRVSFGVFEGFFLMVFRV